MRFVVISVSSQTRDRISDRPITHADQEVIKRVERKRKPLHEHDNLFPDRKVYETCAKR